MEAQKINTNVDQNQKEEKKPGLFAKILFLGIIPLLFTVVLGVILLNYAGYDVAGKTRSIVSHAKNVFAKKENPKPNASQPTNQKASPNNQNHTQTTNAQGSNAKTTNTIGSGNNTMNTPTTTTSSPQVPNSSFSTSLANMDPSSAAKLLNNMNMSDALKALKQLDPDTQSSILSELPPDAGARFSEALANGQGLASKTDSSKQLYSQMNPNQIVAVLGGIQDNQEVLKQFKQLDSTTASKVLPLLNPKVAGWIVSHLK